MSNRFNYSISEGEIQGSNSLKSYKKFVLLSFFSMQKIIFRMLLIIPPSIAVALTWKRILYRSMKTYGSDAVFAKLWSSSDNRSISLLPFTASPLQHVSHTPVSVFFYFFLLTLSLSYLAFNAETTFLCITSFFSVFVSFNLYVTLTLSPPSPN